MRAAFRSSTAWMSVRRSRSSALAAVDDWRERVERAAPAHAVAQQVELLAQHPQVVHGRSGQSFGKPDGTSEKKPQLGSTRERLRTVRVAGSTP